MFIERVQRLNPSLVAGGIEACVAVDIQCMQAVQRRRMRIGHVGHLVHGGADPAT